jgi:23S rRNA (uracil1939-C5)-methyltransferase
VSRTVGVTIDSIASGGDGVGRVDGLVVFIPRTAPGDVVTASISGKGHFARGTLRSIVHPSSQRVDPVCPHYTRDHCGGCQLQHIQYESQLSAKQRMITDAMQRIGMRQIDALPIRESEHAWRYRTKLTLALRRRGEHWIAGMHAYDDPAHVFSLSQCPITDDRVMAVWQEVMDAARFLPKDPDLRGSVRWTTDGAIFVLMGGRNWTQHGRFFAEVPTLSALYWEPFQCPRRLLEDRRTTSSPGASFAQINPSVAAELRHYVVDRVTSHTPTKVVDAYAGSGDLAVDLTRQHIKVTTIELDADAVAWSRERLPEHATTVHARVEEALPKHLPADVIVLNPPRTGLHADVPAALSDAKPRAVIYVSCDPATLARDVSRLTGYRLASIMAFDMFPQTSHVETVCELVPEAA